MDQVFYCGIGIGPKSDWTKSSSLFHSPPPQMLISFYELAKYGSTSRGAGYRMKSYPMLWYPENKNPVGTISACHNETLSCYHATKHINVCFY